MHVSAWWLLPLALAACLAVVAIGACLSPKPRHAAPRRHLAAVPDVVAEAARTLAESEEHRVRHGSMILAEERRLTGLPPLWADWDSPEDAIYDAPDWREQTAADLSPEALEDSGPGGLSSLTPGPDPIVLNMLAPPVEGPQWFNPIPTHVEPRDWSSLAAPSRLADTADVMDARLLAEVEAMMRAQDDDTALYLSRLRSACAQARLDLQAALA